MPRICPMQLLHCLSILLSPNGGIKSRDEVHRLVRLMRKFSMKLVSKCIYIQILKCTETDLLGLFMGSGGWQLVHMWLTDSIAAENWPLGRELLELLLVCPVDIERLKTNNCPKLVKELSKDSNHLALRALASKLVEQWLKIVKGEQVVPIQLSEIPQIISEAQKEESEVKKEIKPVNDENKSNKPPPDEPITIDDSPLPESLPDQMEQQDKSDSKDNEKEPEALPVLRISFKNGKQVISQVDDNDSRTSDDISEKDKIKDKQKSKSREKRSDGSSSGSKSSSSKHSSKSSSSNDKHKSSHKSSSSRHSSRDGSREKEKHSSHSSKSRHNSSNSSSSSSKRSSSSSSSKSKVDKSKHSEKERSKDKDDKGKESPKSSTDKSEEKVGPPSIHKLGKIPKLSDVKREKPSISIEVRKSDEPKPKTVKTFHSKFRKHGLEEEVKPPPSRAALLSKKPPPVLPSTIPIPKRPSPVHNDTPPEKKLKTIDVIEKPGSIKLIPPKPKPMMLLESDMFMDALNASATNKKDPKKRKRRTSGSRDGSAPNDSSPPHTPTSILSPNSESKSVPPRFYQDTLDTDDKQGSSEKNSENSEEPENDKETEKDVQDKMDTSEPHTLTVNGLKGVLCYHKRKGPKKSIRWKPNSELEEIQYFELDETERVNVTRTFTDMKHLERINEREAFEKARNLSTDDIMEERTSWKPLITIDLDGQIHVEYGKNSKEKDIQAIRQKGTLQPLYFHKSMIPDSPFEPDPETHIYAEPTIIPLEDVTGNQDNISDFRNMPWPEPKGNAPPSSNTNMNVPPLFPPNMSQFPTNFPGAQFPGVPPGYQGPPVIPNEWQNGASPHMMPNGIPGPMPTANLPPGPMPPGMMMPPDNMMMGPDMFGAPNPMFPVPPDGFNMQQNMFPMDFNMSGPQGPPGPDNFPGPGNFRGAMRGRGAGGHWRGKSGGNWEGPPRGRGGHVRGGRKVVCIYFQRKGSCRQGDNCSFLHPGVNGPY